MQDHLSSFKISSLAALSDHLDHHKLKQQLIGDQSSGEIAPLQVLTSRDRYHCGHIRCSAAEESFVPAIFFEGQYYSLLRTEHVVHDAFRIATHMMRPDRLITLTKIPKGYAIWILEPEAVPSPTLALRLQKATISAQQTSSVSLPPEDQVLTTDPPYKILTAEDQYQLFHLQLPHTVGHNLAVRVNDYYYRSFQVVSTIRQAAKTVKLLAHYGERSVITKMPDGYGIWRFDTTLNLNKNHAIQQVCNGLNCDPLALNGERDRPKQIPPPTP